jgi:SNF2 family DNA or RNA helicase
MQDPDQQQRYFGIQGAFTGTEDQTGPPLDLCVTVLGMELVPNDDLDDKREKYACTLLPDVKETFFPYQVTGAVFILLCLYGTIPLPTEHANEPAVVACLNSLKRLQTFGCIVADTTGLGKTKETLLALSFSIRFQDEQDDTGKSIYKPSLIAVPSQLVMQWVKEIRTHWPFQLLISYDKDEIDDNNQSKVISSKVMKQFAETGKGLDKRFKRNFNENDRRARETIVLTSIDTHAERTTWVETVHHAAVSFDPPRYDEVTGVEKFAEAAYDEHFYRSWIVVVDEAHGIKNVHTQNFASIFTLKARYKILVTATPMQNNQSVSCFLYLFIHELVLS